MSDAIREQIYSTLDQKETDELLAIWQANNRAEWSETAFDVIREILEARQGELPVQHAPVLESKICPKNPASKTRMRFSISQKTFCG